MDDNQIWSPYERNFLYYHKCKDLKTCPNIHDNYCYCCSNAIVHPTIMADCGFLCESIKPNINKKCYIQFGEICSICMEPIKTKTTAWLTPCSHAFHRKCLINNYTFRQTHKMTIPFSNEIPCPVCREGHVGCCIGLETLDKYNSNNGLDKLENFWTTIDLVPYKLCYTCNKGMGMNKICKTCVHYRDTGC